MSEVNVNSINRLNEIILKTLHVDNGIPIKNMWAEVFEVDCNDTYRILYNLAELNKIIENVKEEIDSIEKLNKDIYLKPILSIERAIKVLDLNTISSGFKSRINDNTIQALAFCVDVLSREKSVEKIDEEEIKNIQKNIEEFIEEIINSDIADELKDFILKNLNNTRDAIINYRLRGLEGLKDAIEKSVGQIFYNSQLIKKNDGSEFVRRIFGILTKIELMLSIGSNGQSLLEPVTKFFLGQ